MKVIDLEDVGPAFRAGRDDLRGFDLGETLRPEVLPESAEELCLDLENCTHLQRSHRDGAVVEDLVEVDLRQRVGLVDFQRRLLG